MPRFSCRRRAKRGGQARIRAAHCFSPPHESTHSVPQSRSPQAPSPRLRLQSRAGRVHGDIPSQYVDVKYWSECVVCWSVPRHYVCWRADVCSLCCPLAVQAHASGIDGVHDSVDGVREAVVGNATQPARLLDRNMGGRVLRETPCGWSGRASQMGEGRHVDDWATDDGRRMGLRGVQCQ